MKQYLKKTVYLVTAILFFCNSCSNNFLDLSNPDTISPANFPATIADMELLVTSCYAHVGDFNLYGKRVMAKGPCVSDHTFDLAFPDPQWIDLGTNNYHPADDWFETLWFGYYEVVNAANMVLEEADKINTDKFSDADLARLEQIRGEAYFWRGWAYQQLVQFWGEGYPCNGDGDKQGVIIFTSMPTNTQDMNRGRSTVNEVYEQVLSDYDEAEKRLPDSWKADADKSRPTTFSVRSFRGQVYLFQGNNESAKTDLKNVIDKSGKSLLPFDEYSKMFNEDQTKFNNESIQEINFGDYASSGWGVWDGGTGSMHAMLISLYVLRDNDKDNPDGGESLGWSNVFFHDGNIARFGSDPRLYITSVPVGTRLCIDGDSATEVKYNFSGDTKGWAVKKYNPLSYSTYSVGPLSTPINMYLMRLADVYLMYAEACQATNDETNAREYVNKVRRRAYNLPINSPSAVDYTSSGTQLRDDIREERFLELCAEGVQHWCDVCRWKTLDQEIKKWYPVTNLAGPPVYSSKSLYYPIPKKEMLNNTAIKQSTGYEGM